MFKAYKVRLYPSNEQQNLINRTFGCVRKVWNLMWFDYKSSYEETGKGKINTPASYKKEYEFLKEIDSLALCNAQMNLKQAYFNFFNGLKNKKRVGYPRPKSKRTSKRTYTTNNVNNNIEIEGSFLKLPKIGKVKAVIHRYIRGEIKSVTISQNPAGHYYASILVDQNNIKSIKEIDNNNVIGVDMSLSDLAVLSTGMKPKYPRWYRQSEKKLAKAQKNLSRKQKGSNNREKARREVGKVYEKITNQRKDFLHKLSYRITKEFDVVVVEDINLQAMSRCLNLGKSVHDTGFGMFRTYLQYKLEDQSKLFIKADRWFASSQTCSNCNFINKETKDLSVREWVCPKCGSIHDRDINAGKNLVNWYKSTVAQTESYACGDHVRPNQFDKATVVEAGKVDKNYLSSPNIYVGVC